MAESDKYAELAAKAENAVQGIKDPELKRVAFEKILDDLLTGGSARTESRRTSKSKKSAENKKKTRSLGPIGYVREMVDEGFFKKPKTIAQVKADLENRGHHIPLSSLSGPLQKLCQNRALRRQKKKTTGHKEAYTYSEW